MKDAELEPVQLDGVLRNSLFGEEGGDLEPMVTLQLDDLSHLFVLDERPVTGKFLDISEHRERQGRMEGRESAAEGGRLSHTQI